MWFKKYDNPLNSGEYEKLSKRIVELAGMVEELQNKFKILTTNYDNLRGNFNRKLSGLKKEETEEEMTETTKDIKPNVFLSPNGFPI